MNRPEAHEALRRLQAYVEREGFRGYDPYDTLNARLPLRRLGRWVPILAVQAGKRSPLNFRPLVGIAKGHNPKGMGLLLHAYALRYAHTADAADAATARFLFEWLCANTSAGYSGSCWGYNFDWASPAKYLPAHTPSVVVTGFVAKGLYAYHQATGDARAKAVLRSACDFVLGDLPRTETADGLCFSYTPMRRDACYNASLLGAETLVRAYALTGEASLRDLAAQAVAFVLARQHADGRWNYSLDLATGAERAQVDFHQGFVLDALDAYLRLTAADDARCRAALARGAHFYRHAQFTDEGRARWRLPRQWPADIHHQAQGILTFSRLRALGYGPFAETVARWTVAHMQDPDGFFYYRKGRFLTNRLPFMRWGQAWMMLALATLLQPAEAAPPHPARLHPAS